MLNRFKKCQKSWNRPMAVRFELLEWVMAKLRCCHGTKPRFITNKQKIVWLPVYQYIVLGNRGKNQGYFSCLANCIAPQPIALESCSNLQKSRQVFESAMEKIVGFRFCFFVSDVITKVSLWPFLAAGTW